MRYDENMNSMILLTSLSILVILGASTQFTFDFNTFAQINQGHGHFHSLKEILEDRKMGDPLTCPNPEHVLVLRPNSNWACVYFETAKHLNWDTVLYSEPDAPQITTSVFFRGGYHNITYQTNEGVVDYVENIKHPIEVVDSIENTGDDGSNSFFLLIAITPTQEGYLTVTLPSSESSMFENYCVESELIPESESFEYRTNHDKTLSMEIEEYSDSTRVKLYYEYDTEFFEISLYCLI